MSGDKQIVLKGDVALSQIASNIWNMMEFVTEKYGYCDLSLTLEGAARDIWDIIKENNIVHETAI